MSRLIKYLALPVLVLFVLACNAVTQPFNQAQDLAGTAQSIASALPMETLKSLATQISTAVPMETLEALPSLAPSLEAVGSQIPDFGNFFNPEGTPVSEWNGIPVMPQATAGQEFTDSNTYSFKVDATIQEVQDYYKAELEKLGWTSSFNMPGNDKVAVELFQKDSSFLTVTITERNGTVVVCGSWKKDRASVSRRDGTKPGSNKYRPRADSGKRPQTGAGERYCRAGYTRRDGTKVRGHYVTRSSR